MWSCGFGTCPRDPCNRSQTFPLQTGRYEQPGKCATPDSGDVAGPVCDQAVTLDGTAGTVTQRFVADGHIHVIRYRVTSTAAITKDKNVGDVEFSDSP